MNRTDQIQELESNIRNARKIVEQGDAVERLRVNRDFKKVIVEGYFEQEAIRLVHLKADPAMQSPERQASLVSQIDAIGAVSAYLRTVLSTADMARKAIASDESEIEALNEEEAEENDRG